jgi:hypothetical protein
MGDRASGVYEYKKGRPCYFCGADSVSEEHAPPEMLFKCINRKDRGWLSAPACRKHNSGKSQSDFAILTSMVRAIKESMKADGVKKQVSENVINFINRYEANFKDTNRTVTLKKFVSDAPPGFDIELPYSDASLRTQEWILWMTAVLTWTATGTHSSGSDWSHSIVWSPDFCRAGIASHEIVEYFGNIREIRSRFENLGHYRAGWQPRKPYPPDLFRFDVVTLGEGVCFRHTFFDTFTWYVLFLTSEATAANLKMLLC